MIDIAIALYLISLLSNLKEVSGGLIMLFLCICTVTGIVTFASLISDRELPELLKNFLRKFVKPLAIFVFIPAVLVRAAVPDERTMYMIAGLYAGDKIVQTIADSEIGQQAQNTLIAKLKELETEFDGRNGIPLEGQEGQESQEVQESK